MGEWVSEKTAKERNMGSCISHSYFLEVFSRRLLFLLFENTYIIYWKKKKLLSVNKNLKYRYIRKLSAYISSKFGVRLTFVKLSQGQIIGSLNMNY